jgi:NAD-dependent SIR2 family protein deacetylase
MSETIGEAVRRAAAAVARADALVFTAGAGMGVDSGLPDFRGREGFWNAYPAYRDLGLDFASMANPAWFRRDPAMAWGFYGHRFHLYRQTAPHAGFQTLLRWAYRAPQGAFVVTSNIDGHFQRAGFDPGRVVEVHGAIDWLQCSGSCGADVFPAGEMVVKVDPATFRASLPHPACPHCGELARPNVLMFGDFEWDSSRTDLQHEALGDWLEGLQAPSLVVVECGAGTAVSTIRNAGENLVRRLGATLVRINTREPEVPRRQVSIALGAAGALHAIDRAMVDP